MLFSLLGVLEGVTEIPVTKFRYEKFDVQGGQRIYSTGQFTDYGRQRGMALSAKWYRILENLTDIFASPVE
jgi:hypothetical protein